MTETAETKLNFNPSDTNDEMFRKIVSAFQLPEKPIKSYTKETMLTLIGILFQIIRGLVRDCSEKTDQIESLNFETKKSSKTSSLRPSSDGYAGVGSHKIDPDNLSEEESVKLQRKDHDRSNRKPSGKKPGHQTGEKSTGFHFSDKSVFKEPEIIMPVHCLGCKNYKQCLENGKKNPRRNVEDVSVEVTVHTFQTVTVECPKDGETYSGDYPVEATGPAVPQ